MEAFALSQSVTAALAEVSQRVQRSLVVVQTRLREHDGWRGAGAGIVWQADGIIVTNLHVVAQGRPWVTLPDGRQVPAMILAKDKEIDLALLKVEASDLPVAQVADSRGLRVGEIVLAVGHPWGQHGVVTWGIVSSLGEVPTHGPRRAVPIIRSDVSLAPGNSGGPLVNIVGGVVGMNTMIVGGDLGISIPSHLISEFVERARKQKEEMMA